MSHKNAAQNNNNIFKNVVCVLRYRLHMLQKCVEYCAFCSIYRREKPPFPDIEYKNKNIKINYLARLKHWI